MYVFALMTIKMRAITFVVAARKLAFCRLYNVLKDYYNLLGHSIVINITRKYSGGQAITHPWPLLGVKWPFSKGGGRR